MPRSVSPFACVLLAAAALAQGQPQPPAPPPAAPAPPATPTQALPPLQLRLVPLLDGLRSEAPGGDLAKIGETRVGKEAAKCGVDLLKVSSPYVVFQLRGGRFFYLFYKNVEDAFGERPYVIQRIQKIERTWAADGAQPVEKVSWFVEVFKTSGGQLKGGSDEHFGSFGLGGAVRREIEKRCEIGFGEIPGACEGKVWPFAADKLAIVLQEFQADPGVYDRIQFSRSKKWRLTASFGQDGRAALVCPDLGIDTANGLPLPARIPAPPDATSREWTLVAGQGLGAPALALGVAFAAAKVALGEPLEDVEVGQGHRNVSFRGGLTANFDEKGALQTLATRPGFAGRTKDGIGHGATRDEVKKKLGAPKGGDEKAARWRYPGLVVVFDAFDAVVKIVVGKG